MLIKIAKRGMPQSMEEELSENTTNNYYRILRSNAQARAL